MPDKKIKITAWVLGGLLLAVLILLAVVSNFPKISLQPPAPAEVKISTEKTEYQTGEALRVKIVNDLNKEICFSSCFPYYLERENEEGWKNYLYNDGCESGDLVERCVNPKEIKAFELVLPTLKEGTHRLAVPACLGCAIQETFKKDQWFYSNPFIVK